MRKNNRKYNELRYVEIIPNVNEHAEGSCLVKFGNTHVICNATIDEKVPRFIKNSGSGWITAEYGMLPRSTGTRMNREAATGKQGGRTMEIQRLIGRSLRSAVNLKALGEKQIIIDCDVIQADGGTRTAAITGGYVALELALRHLKKQRMINIIPVISPVVAVSVAVVDKNTLLDVDYMEDSNAELDANFVFNGEHNLIEIQATGEKRAFSTEEFTFALELAKTGAISLLELQQKVLSNL